LKIGQRDIGGFASWPSLIFQVLVFSASEQPLIQPYQKKITFHPGSFFKHKKPHPVTGKEAFVFEIDATIKLSIPENLLSETEKTSGTIITPPASITDLHIEKLIPGEVKIEPSEILNHQIAIFSKTLENAIATGLPEITFIHGVGNGTLRNKIHKSLSHNPNVEFFKDALKEKFGYGATYVKIKA
jgi:hypothetical protein